jgi:hypothetical protein
MLTWEGEFEWRGATGRVQVECVPNDDPGGYGTAVADAFGFPVCTATVRYPRKGFNAMFGWVQMVRSTDNQSAGERFEMDPFELFGDWRSPYFCYGIEPTLFDAPSRRQRVPVEWLAHSFLATTPVDEWLDGNPRRVVPLLGFQWGFDIRPETAPTVDLRPVAPLAPSDWTNQLPMLKSEYPAPSWSFADSF